MHQRYNKFKYHKLYHSIPISCALALLLLSSICINPLDFEVSESGNKAYAEEGISELADNGISLSIDGNSSDTSYSKSVTANTNATSYIPYNITATASNIENYSLTIKYTDGSTSLKNDANGATTINPVTASGIQGKNMTSNTWGWGWSNSTSTANADITYRPMQTSDSVMQSENVSAANINGKVVFAANFAEGATAGHYQANVLVSFAIKPQEVTAFGGITNMQQMTSSICNTAAENETSQLIDTRDNKKYWVTKLKDGNCWMTQNLALDLTTSGLSASNSDLSTNWTTSSSMPIVATVAGKTDLVTDTAAVTSGGFNTYVVVNSTSYGVKSVIGYTAASNSDYTAIIDDTSKVYNAHYLMGNFYTWYAATAGGQTNYSICPKNWKLPTSAQFTNMTNGYVSSSDNNKYLLADSTAHIIAGTIASGTVDIYGMSGYPYARYATTTSSVGFNMSVPNSSYAPTNPPKPTAEPNTFAHAVRCLVKASEGVGTEDPE